MFKGIKENIIELIAEVFFPKNFSFILKNIYTDIEEIITCINNTENKKFNLLKVNILTKYKKNAYNGGSKALGISKSSNLKIE